MSSLHALSSFALSSTSAVALGQPKLAQFAEARLANTITFLEIEGRATTTSVATNPFPSIAGFTAGPLSSMPLSGTALSSGVAPQIQRQTTKVLFSTRPWCGSPTDSGRSNQRAVPRLVTGGRISRSIPIDIDAQRRSQRTIGDARFLNPDGALDYLLSNFALEGGTIRCWLGSPQDDSGAWALLYEATIGSVSATRKEISVSISTVSDQLNRAFQLRRYSGTGGAGGGSDLKGRLLPVGYGEIYGAEPVLVSGGDRIYQVHDGRIQAVDWVREGGLDFTFVTDVANYDDLRSVSLNLGEYATCLAGGYIKIGTTLAGLQFPLRVGFKGDASGNGYISSTGSILYRIARDRGFVIANNLDVASFQGLPSGRIGYYFKGDTEKTCADVFDELLRGVAASYGVGRASKISAQRLIPASQQTNDVNAREDQVFDSRVEVLPFVARRSQPYTFAPTADPVSESEVSPLADESTRERLTRAAATGTVTQNTAAALGAQTEPTLSTFFSEESSAVGVAANLLTFTSQNTVPMRVDLGRLGLLADIGSVLAVDSARFTGHFRGVVYQQEDNLGATVTSRVVALG